MGNTRLSKVILGTICWLIISVFLILPLSFLFISKCLVILVAYTFRSDLYSISTGDAAFAIDSSWKKSKVSVGFVLRLEGVVELASVQQKFSSSLLEPKVGQKPKHDKLFSCLATFGGFVFRKIIELDLANLNDLIHEKHLGPNESLEDLIAKWIVVSYREDAPAWEMLLIQHIHPPSTNCMNSTTTATFKSAVAFKIHHAFADGYSLLHILDTITDNSSPYLVKDIADSWFKSITDVLALPISLKMLDGEGSPRTNPLRVLRPQANWIYTFTSVDLEPIKQIRKRQGVHFASIILTLLTGAIRQFMLIDSDVKEKLPSHISLADTLPWPRHPRNILCNHWTLGIIKAPMKWDDPLKRLIEVEQNFLDFHSAGLHKCAKQFLFPLSWLSPQVIMKNLLTLDPGYNSGLTSLVGADNYRFLGNSVSHIHPLLNFSDSNPYTTFSWFTFTQSKKMDVSLAGAPDLFRNRNALERVLNVYFKKELQKLCIQCGVSSSEELVIC